MILRNCLKTCACVYLNTCRQYSYLTRPSSFKQLNLYTHKYNINPNLKASLDVNTNVVKDVILYKYDNPRRFKMINLFALCQFGFWTYFSHFAFTTMRDAPVKEPSADAAWWRKINLGEQKYRFGITMISFMLGYGVLVAAWMFSLKSVRYLILRKGGKAVTFVTYGPFGKNRMMTVDLKYVSCKEMREKATSFLPIKVKNQYLHYILDASGEFKNKQLFDHTAGLKRVWKD